MRRLRVLCVSICTFALLASPVAIAGDAGSSATGSSGAGGPVDPWDRRTAPPRTLRDGTPQ